MIPAQDAPVAAVLRRGPSDWCQLGRWDLAASTFQPGAWLRGTIRPQTCDLSPDGRWFAYTAVKYPGTWAGGPVYQAVSRLPWLTALATWALGTTYARGVRFTPEPGRNDLGPPDAGDVAPLVARVGLALRRPEQFSVERDRGWVEAAGTPPREEGGPWDERREVELVKDRPDGGDGGRTDGPTGPRLHVQGGYAAFRTSPDWYDPPLYHLSWPDREVVLEGVQWADWDRAGRLLVATVDGRLQVRDVDVAAAADPGGTARVRFEVDLAPSTPDPRAAPPEARRW